MLKAVLNSDDKEKGPVIVIGFSRKNLERLLEFDNHVTIDMAELGLGNGTIFVVGGETEDAIAKTLDLKMPTVN